MKFVRLRRDVGQRGPSAYGALIPPGSLLKTPRGESAPPLGYVADVSGARLNGQRDRRF